MLWRRCVIPLLLHALLSVVSVGHGEDVVAAPRLVPRLQVVACGKVEHVEPGFTTPRTMETFPLGAINGARWVEKSGEGFWVFPAYRFGLDTVAPKTVSLCLRFDGTKTVSAIGTLGAGDVMLGKEAAKLSCVLSSGEGVYRVEDRVSASDLNAQYWPAGTLLSWKFLIFWEEE